MKTTDTATPQARLRHHVTGAIERGEKQPIIAVENTANPAPQPASPAARHTPGPWRFTCNASRIELKTDAMHSYAFSLSDEANARLIAAAPELLAALEEVWSFWAGGDCPPELEEKIKLAIASAKGGAA